MANQHLSRLQNLDDTFNGITTNSIKYVLFDRYKSIHQPNPLDCLLIVDDVLRDQLLPDGLFVRRHVLMELLDATIANELNRYRKAMDVCLPLDSTRVEAFAAIKNDARAGNNNLIGWSWIYYRWTRDDLHITQELYSQISNVDDRTIRRHQDIVFLQLAHILIRMEVTAQQARIKMIEAALKPKCEESEIIVTLKPETIIQMFQSDESLLRAFIELYEEHNKVRMLG